MTSELSRPLVISRTAMIVGLPAASPTYYTKWRKGIEMGKIIPIKPKPKTVVSGMRCNEKATAGYDIMSDGSVVFKLYGDLTGDQSDLEGLISILSNLILDIDDKLAKQNPASG